MSFSSQPSESQALHRRTHLTDENKIALMKLCVENQADFQERKKGQFWAIISGLLQQEAGISLKDPAGTVKGIVVGRRAQVRIQQRESGTVQEDTEFTQVVDRWIEIEDERERARKLARQPRDQAAKESYEAELHRSNLLRSTHLKRYYSSGSSRCPSENDMNEEVEEESGREGQEIFVVETDSTRKRNALDPVKQIGSLRKKTRHQAVREDGHELTTAVRGMADAVALVAEKLGARAENTQKMQDMGQRLDSMEDHLREEGDIRNQQSQRVEERQEKTNELLEGILLKLGKD